MRTNTEEVEEEILSSSTKRNTTNKITKRLEHQLLFKFSLYYHQPRNDERTTTVWTTISKEIMRQYVIVYNH